MYEIFAKLLEMNNVKAADVCKGTGLPSSLFSEWKKGKSTPKVDKLQKIADYFGVTLNYLMTGEESGTEENRNKELKGVYFNFAKEMQEKKVSEDDMKRLWDFYEMIQNARK